MSQFQIQPRQHIVTPQGKTLPFNTPAEILELWGMWDDIGYPHKYRVGFKFLDANGVVLYEHSAYHALILEGEAYQNWDGSNEFILQWASGKLGVSLMDEIIPPPIEGNKE